MRLLVCLNRCFPFKDSVGQTLIIQSKVLRACWGPLEASQHYHNDNMIQYILGNQKDDGEPLFLFI